MARVVHFEIQVGDLDRARAFYERALGWTFQDWTQTAGTPYLGAVTGPEDQAGINGGMVLRPAPAPSAEQGTNAYVCTVGVEDYDTTHERILGAGGQVALPKFALPGIAWQGYYLDTEGNTFGVHQSDENAA
jgi:hypothetical protein